MEEGKSGTFKILPKMMCGKGVGLRFRVSWSQIVQADLNAPLLVRACSGHS